MKRVLNGKGSSAGFFVVEIVVALLILSIVLAVLVPSWTMLHERMHDNSLKRMAVIIVQNELIQFEHYLVSNEGMHSITLNGQSFDVHWYPVQEQQKKVEEWLVTIQWHRHGQSYRLDPVQTYRAKVDTPL